jgi:prepilin-type N-terminal cleavage/methylation domain-containing protein
MSSHECEHGTQECVRHKPHSNNQFKSGNQGKPANQRKVPNQGRRGVTLIELLVVVALISLIVGISFPAITSGIDSLRLNAATNSIVGFLNTGLDRAQRRQQMVAITISKPANDLEMRSTDANFHRTLAMPDGVAITNVLPEQQDNPDAPRTFVLYPGGTVPGFGIELINRRNVERIVRVDPITGVPRVERPEP